MIQLDEIFDCEIIALKKGKNGVYTLKFITKEQKNKNERILERKRKPNYHTFGRNCRHGNSLVENRENYARTEASKETGESRSEEQQTSYESAKTENENRQPQGG